jgi:hypothetical protein
MVKQGINISFDKEAGHLRIDCDGEEFDHIRSLVLAEASAADQLALFEDGIRSIVLRRPPPPGAGVPGRPGRILRYVAIAAALLLALAIQVVGIVAIALRLLGHHS